MRTTVTLDEDVARELKSRAKKADKSFKEVLNDCLRLAFSLSRSSIRKMRPFHVQPHSSPFRPGIDIDKLNQLSDQLEVEDRIQRLRPRR
ncbi:MAG TPA: hypothetical protein VH815_03515 [Acidobacteriota bacterium]|jgi:hypothetical protein